jgi:hypothetical protein
LEFQIDHAVEVLSQTPDVFSALLRGKSDVWLHCRKTPDAFSPVDVIGHLMHGEITNWMPRVRMIVEGKSDTPFEPFDRFAFQPLIAAKPIGKLLAEFAKLRRESLRQLSDLRVGQRELELIGRHPEFGRITLSNLLATWTVHDLGHIAQVLKTMSNEYRDAVGPWRAYMSILT